MRISQPDVGVGHMGTRVDVDRIARDHGLQQLGRTVQEAERFFRLAACASLVPRRSQAIERSDCACRLAGSARASRSATSSARR